MKWIVSKVNPSANFCTIYEAILNANDDDEIYIYTGHYKEKLIINKEIKIIGVGKVIIYNDCDLMDHVISIKEKCNIDNLTIISNNSNILYIYNCMDVEIHNCKMISYSQNCINIYDAGFFTIKNCIMESKKNAIDYNNILNVFNHSGTIINSNIVSDENCIKLFNNSNLSIINSTLKSNYKCATLYENTYLVIKESSIQTPNHNYILFKKNANPKHNLLIEDVSFIYN